MERALIIGASGGIGSAIADRLAAGGAEVIRLSRRDEGLDVTDPDGIDGAFAQLDGPFDRIVIATGILALPGAQPEKALSAITPEAMAASFAVNAIGPALLLARLGPFIPRDRRAVVAVLTARVGSIGDNQLGGWYSYRAAKAAANQITRTAAIEIARRRKHAIVVALHPGTVATPFTANYPDHKKVSADDAARNLINVMDGLTPAETGQFFDWAGKPVPW